MAKDPSFPWYASDWLGSNRRAMMTLEQQGAYMNLLCRQWTDKTCSLPDDDDALAQLSELGEGWFKGGCQVLRLCFPKHPHLEGRIASPKLLQLRLERDEWKRKSAQGGRTSGKTRRAKSRRAKTSGTRRVVEPPYEPNANQTRTKGEPNANTPSPSLLSSCSTNKNVSRARKFRYDEADMELARHVLAGCRQVVPTFREPSLEAWANDIRLMREQDGREHEEIQALFDWANRDDFWRANILSPRKLRKQWDSLQAQRTRGAKRDHHQAGGSSGRIR